MYFKPVSINSDARPLINFTDFSSLIDFNSGGRGPSYLINSNLCLKKEILWFITVSIISLEIFLENNKSKKNSDLI